MKLQKVRRRDVLKLAGATAVAAAIHKTLASDASSGPSPNAWGQAGLTGAWAGGKYTLPDLPYPADALAPIYEERTVRLHHDKHHAGYVKGLNAALEALAAALIIP